MLINTAPCHHALCYNGGNCDDHRKGNDGCICVNGWQGADCRASNRSEASLFKLFFLLSILGSCGHHGPICHNGGLCVSSSNGSFICKCEHPWFGPTCEER